MGIVPKYVPFTIFVRVIPINGSRFERVRDREELGNRVEDGLTTLETASTGSCPFYFNTPVKSTPQFGDITARLTVEGHMLRDELAKRFVGRERIGDEVEENLVINTSEYVEGPGALNAQKEPDSTLDDAVAELKSDVEGILPSFGTLPSELEIFRIEIGHQIYGAGGRTFPE
jgi:hypothetical protein